jgi:hypothetical protein
MGMTVLRLIGHHFLKMYFILRPDFLGLAVPLNPFQSGCANADNSSSSFFFFENKSTLPT